jgi:epoxyqueuosine reductase
MDTSISQLSARIRKEALRLGFTKVGIAQVRPLPGAERLITWLENGWQGEMRYMERQAAKRLDPNLVMPDARSLLVLALNYYPGSVFSQEPMKGRISRYAVGDDYHDLIMNRLKKLLSYIKEQNTGAEGMCYVDTGPVMEKTWGVQAALGWMGKHTNLISRECGSWFFIGIILLNRELEYDHEEKNLCGNCDRCIKACPTGAITAPYRLDARRCISYLTIEFRGVVPEFLRPLMGNRIFGCDACQEVCPWNRFSKRVTESDFTPREGTLMPDLLSLISITPEEFRKRFNGSPILRATRDGFVRNVVIALGNSGKNEAIPAVKAALQDASPLVRLHAEWALEQLRVSI